ncbi:unnamed protein product [Linum tenue]|uniref:Lunapark zinc ribbon domain-containing protein n=1 Tax=Linum tenue TaxID=586396 RepID=A0AAV0IEG4_9ROSI|nr:unnamed protein product [Linum tenue]
MAEEKPSSKVESESKEAVNADKKKRKGIMSRVWNTIFRLHGGDDFEKRLKYISKEEAAVLTRMKKRSLTWRKMTRNLIAFSVLFEVIAVGYAIMTTRTEDLDWKMRAFRVMPMFLLPAFSSIAYSGFVNFTKMCDRRDQKTLEKLRAERQQKIDELKEKTNYYTTQQLIQRYDTDPAAKAAAASVLASKLGAESGLKLYVGEESGFTESTAKSSDAELVQSSGLRHRKQGQVRSRSAGSTPVHPSNDNTPRSMLSEGPISEQELVVVEHHNPQAAPVSDGGWIARLAALLVGEDPAHSFALICGNCHMHNGLARKEDFPYITYYCPHCHALNQPKQSGTVSGLSTPNLNTSKPGGTVIIEEVIDEAIDPDSPATESVVTSNSAVKGGAAPEIQELAGKAAADESAS